MDGIIIHASSEGRLPRLSGFDVSSPSARKLSMSSGGASALATTSALKIASCAASWAGVMILADLYFLPPRR